MDFLGLWLEEPSQDIWLVAGKGSHASVGKPPVATVPLQKVSSIDDKSETEQHEGPALLKVNARR